MMSQSVSICLFGALSLLFSIFPWPYDLSLVMPNFLVLFILYLNFSKPNWHSSLPFWILGILMDLLQHHILGLTPLAFILMQAFLNQFRVSFMLYPMLQRLMIIFFATLIYLGVIAGFEEKIFWWQTMVQSCLTALIWPWIDFISKPKMRAKKTFI